MSDGDALTFSSRIPEAPLHRRGYYEVRPGDVVTRSDLLFLDVRPQADLLGEFGHIHGVTQVEEARALGGLPELARETPLVLVCNDGRQSMRVAEAMVRDHRFTEVYLLVGGMLRWTAEARPIAKTATWKTLG